MAHRNRWFTWGYLGLPIKHGDFPWLCYINNQSVGFLMYAIAAIAAIAVSHRKAAHTGTTWRRSMTSGPSSATMVGPRNAEVITGGLKRGVPPVIICYHPFIVGIFHYKPTYLWKPDFLYCVPAALSSPSPSLAESEMSFLRPKACELNVMRSLCLPVPEHHPDYQARHDTSPFWVGMRDAL